MSQLTAAIARGRATASRASTPQGMSGIRRTPRDWIANPIGGSTPATAPRESAEPGDDESLPEADPATEPVRAADRGERGVVGAALEPRQAQSHPARAEDEDTHGAQDRHDPQRVVGRAVLEVRGEDPVGCAQRIGVLLHAVAHPPPARGASNAAITRVGRVAMSNSAAVSGEMATATAWWGSSSAMASTFRSQSGSLRGGASPQAVQMLSGAFPS